MKKGKELKVESQRDFSIVFGSVNNKNPRALYINISAWAQPKLDNIPNYNRVIRDTDKKIRQLIFNSLNSNITAPFLKERTIIDFDIKKSGVKYGKRSFSNCEITLYLKYEIPIHSEELRPTIDDLIQSVITQAMENNKYFTFHKKKK